jgi:glyoxylase-like metal-dependent hydrolase (beta-lactamase superfamily II)
MKQHLAKAIAAILFFSAGGLAQQTAPTAQAVIDAATRAMGTASLQSLQYIGTGATYPTGQAYRSGGPWPRYTVKSYTMSINFAAPAMRQELVRVDDANPPRGGGAGGYNPATFQGGIRPIPGDIVQNQDIDARSEIGALNFWLTPHGFLKGAAANAASAKTTKAGGKTRLSFTAFGKYTVTGTLDSQNLVEHVETLMDVAFTGDTPFDATYTDYHDYGGVKFPSHIVMRQSGFPILEVNVSDLRPNNAAAMQIGSGGTGRGGNAGGGGGAAAAPVPLKLADGVWALTPATEGSILVEFTDYVVLVEAPTSDAYTAAAIEAAKKLAPGKPIKYVVNTHHHSDHAGGLRAYVAEGIPIITHESHKKYYEEQIFKAPHTLNPDRLARAPRAPIIEAMRDKRIISDGKMTLELYLLRGHLHAEGLLMTYIPSAKLLIQADAYIPRPGAPPLPAPSPYTTNLVDNVARLKLMPERVVMIHGGVAPWGDVLMAAGR